MRKLTEEIKIELKFFEKRLSKIGFFIYEKKWFFMACLFFIIMVSIFLSTLKDPLLINKAENIDIRGNINYYEGVEGTTYDYNCEYRNKINDEYLRPSSEIFCVFRCFSSDKLTPSASFKMISPSQNKINILVFNRYDSVKCNSPDELHPTGIANFTYFGELGNFELEVEVGFSRDSRGFGAESRYYTLTTYSDVEYSNAFNQRRIMIIAILSLLLTIFVSFKYIRDLFENK